MRNKSNSTQKAKLLRRVPFSISARIALQLGRESISNSIVAILELVKNAYDADSKCVNIDFVGLSTPEARLVITDDGRGMTQAQFSQDWLMIGTENKRKRPTSLAGRVRTGEKGLGRLGLDRLCHTTKLRTIARRSAIELVVEWDKYEKNSSSGLNTIRHDLFAVPRELLDPYTGESRKATPGTQITLLGLRDTWSRNEIKELRKELSLLVSPFGVLAEFSVFLNTGNEEWSELNGRITSSTVLDSADWEVHAEVSGDTKSVVTWHMTSKRHKKKYPFGPTPWSEVIKAGVEGERAQCGPLSMRLYFFPREKSAADSTVEFSRSQIAAFLDANQGVRIYRDGFRVQPYGNPDGDGDWLRLSYRRVQNPGGVKSKKGLWRVGYNQVVGAVFLTRDQNPELIDQTNREGLVEGPAFAALRAFGDWIVRKFEIMRQEFVKQTDDTPAYEVAQENAQKAVQETVDAVEQLKTRAQELQSLLDASPEADPAVSSIGSEITVFVDQVSKSLSLTEQAQAVYQDAVAQLEDEIQRQKDTLGNLASLGILTASFGHETIGSANLVAAGADKLQGETLGSLVFLSPDVQHELEETLSTVYDHATRIKSFASFALKNIGRDKRNRKDVDLKSIITQVFDSFSVFLKDKNITVELRLPQEVPSIRAFAIDWESILVNFISNSVWALEETAAESRKIRVRLSRTGNQLRLSFADSGRGLEAGTERQIFLPTFSTRRNRRGEVVGTGMGLAIVKNFVEDHPGGKIIAQSPSDLGGAEFTIMVDVPSERGQK